MNTRNVLESEEEQVCTKVLRIAVCIEAITMRLMPLSLSLSNFFSVSKCMKLEIKMKCSPKPLKQTFDVNFND